MENETSDVDVSWKEDGVLNGIGQITFPSWHELVTYLHKHMLNYDDYIWRGQRNESWKLKPTLYRDLKNVSKVGMSHFQREHLQRFQYAVRGRRGPNPQALTSENDWWALAQHHGMMTPLLDWTVSPFVAAYFAFFEESDNAQTPYRSIYGLHKTTVEAVAHEIKSQQENEAKNKVKGEKDLVVKALAEYPRRLDVEFIKPLMEQNDRLISQNGLFTRTPFDVSLEEWIDQNFIGESHYILMKLNVPDTDREDALRTLNRMNINHLTLFPDIDGASKYCNLCSKIKSY